MNTIAAANRNDIIILSNKQWNILATKQNPIICAHISTIYYYATKYVLSVLIRCCLNVFHNGINNFPTCRLSAKITSMDTLVNGFINRILD